MRKIIVSINITLDGCMAGPGGELDWHFRSWTTEMGELLCSKLLQADTILLGRITYQAMEQYWPAVVQDPYYSREDLVFADLMNSYRKLVFSRTLDHANWNNSIVIRSNARERLLNLKTKPGKDMLLLGSRQLLTCLQQWGLVDEYLLWLHPVALGKGQAFFRRALPKKEFVLRGSTTFQTGVVALHYS